MSLLDLLRVGAFIIWLTIGLSRVSSIYRVLSGKGRYYDILASMIAGVGFLIASFNLRWFLPPSNELHVALHAFSIMLAVSLLRVLWSYEGAAE